jgi:acyl-CoA reductase-like NAD-dependent aldehyde dehydrogenase
MPIATVNPATGELVEAFAASSAAPRVRQEPYAVRHLATGAVLVDGMTVSHPELPSGGTKDSGIGRELAAEGIREFCNAKTVWRA